MTDEKEPNGYELQRSLEQLRKTVGEGLGDIKAALGLLVSRDLFDSELKRLSEKHDALQKQIDEIAAEAEIRSAKGRWFLAGILIPLLTCLVGVICLFALR